MPAKTACFPMRTTRSIWTRKWTKSMSTSRSSSFSSIRWELVIWINYLRTTQKINSNKNDLENIAGLFDLEAGETSGGDLCDAGVRQLEGISQILLGALVQPNVWFGDNRGGGLPAMERRNKRELSKQRTGPVLCRQFPPQNQLVQILLNRSFAFKSCNAGSIGCRRRPRSPVARRMNPPLPLLLTLLQRRSNKSRSSSIKIIYFMQQKTTTNFIFNLRKNKKI